MYELSGLSAEYTRLFSNTALTDFPPYGANYLASHIFMKAQSLADGTGFYRAFGVDLEAGTERPDHVSVELEFMGYLCLKEAYAADHDLAEALEITTSAQRRFLAEHPRRWAPLFMRRFEAVSSEPFYRALARSAQAFLAAEQARLGVSPDPIAELPVDACAPGDVTCGVNGDKCPLEAKASASRDGTM